MNTNFRSRHNNEHGMTIISTLIATGIIITSIGAIAIPAMQLHKAMKKAELANSAVVVEANLISAFHNKLNFDNTTTAGISTNADLRAGTIPLAFPLITSFGTITLNRNPAGTEAVAIGFLNRDASPGTPPCTAYSVSCGLRYEVHLKKMAGASYSFSYQVDANPQLITMAPLGDVTSFTSPVDSGLYRAEAVKTNCDSVNDLFMRGMNRDTGEAFCVERPLSNKCDDGHLPKGLHFQENTSGPKAGYMEVKCTTAPMRVFSCPDNYAIESFDPRWVDPENTSYGTSVPGSCVFRTAPAATMPAAVSLPASPTAPYRRSVSASVCPPYYRAGNPASCQLVPDTARNASAEGMGKCATVKYKNCTRSTWTNGNDGGAAYNAWVTCSALVPPPAGGCGVQPANPLPMVTCSGTQTSTYCNGVVNSGPTCATVAPTWTLGTAYADVVSDVAPTASANATFSGRRESCSFTDTSTPCTAPATLFDGSTYGRRTAKWFGGVKISGTSCTLDPVLVGSEHLPAQEGPATP